MLGVLEDTTRILSCECGGFKVDKRWKGYYMVKSHRRTLTTAKKRKLATQNFATFN